MLSVSRARVPAELETEYLATLRDLARLAGERGQRLWIFRSRTDPRLFLECSESAGEALHRTRAPRSTEEQRLERRLRELAEYAADAWELFDEIKFDADVRGAG